MKDFLHYLTGQLVENPGAVVVEQQGDGDNKRLLLSVDKGNLGKIIGKKGRTIKAIRTVLAVVAKQHNERVSLEISSSLSATDNATPHTSGES